LYAGPQKVLQQLIPVALRHGAMADDLPEAEVYIFEDVDHELE
jgi:hypothetical protein